MSNKTSNQRVSYIIPTYGGSDTIRETIDSIKRQTINPYSIIVVVDKRDVDNTPEIIESEYPCVTMYQFESNVGHAVALNKGIKEAESDFVAICDDDIRLPNDWAESILEEFSARDSDLALVQPRIEEPDYTRDDFGEIAHFQSCGVMAKREPIKEVGYFDDDYFVYRDDYQLAAALLNHGYTMRGVDTTTTYHKGTHNDIGLPPLKAYYETRNEIWNRFRYHSRLSTLIRLPRWIIRRLLSARRSNTVLLTLKGILAGFSRPRYLLWDHEFCEEQSSN